jgi:hypothetical protein
MRGRALAIGAISICTVFAWAPQASAAPVRGDFNGDGRSDLAVGTFNEDISGVENAGAVNLIYGGKHGLRARGDQFFDANSPGMAGNGAQADDWFGTSLVAGDFNGDGHEDLAIGEPGNGGGELGDGAVHVLYGARHRLTTRHDRVFTQRSSGIAGDGSQQGDSFGYAVAAGDFNGDGRDDLAVTAPNEGNGSGLRDGAVTILYGSRKGLRTKRSRLFSETSPGIASDGAQDGDQLGLSIGEGDLNGDGRDDLAIGIPHDTDAGVDSAGAVIVLYGSPRGLRTKRSLFLDQSDVGDTPEQGDAFGAALATGRFEGHRAADLAVGIQFDNNQPGAVSVFRGSRTGIDPSRNRTFTPATPGIAGDGIEGNELYGDALAAGRFNGDRKTDLAIGSRGENIGPVFSAGAVVVLYGSSTGLETNGSQFLHQGALGIPGDAPGDDDEFGDALAAGNFGRSRQEDLAIGTPLDDVPNGDNNQDGTVDLVYGGRRGLRPSHGQEINQGSPGIADQPEANDFFGASLAPPEGNVLTNVFD